MTAMDSPSSSNVLNGTLHRQQANKAAQKSTAFGTALMMNKDDYEKDRLRWQQKFESVERRLIEAEGSITDMNLIKAELNKKIVEMDRNQRPLIEQNRRLCDRTRLLQNEIKKSEQKLSHSQDDFLSLKDAHDKLLKENMMLKEKRMCPEKLEELERCRTQILECSKCITALRHAGLAKDRRYESLVQKYKRLKMSAEHKKSGECEDEKLSACGSSEGSVASSASIIMINPDIRELENASDASFTVTQLRTQIIQLQAKYDQIERERYELKEMSELLEFQFLETSETMKHELEMSMTRAGVDVGTETYVYMPDELYHSMPNAPPRFDSKHSFDVKWEIENLKRLFCLNNSQRLTLYRLQTHLESLENELLQSELNYSSFMRDCTIREVEHDAKKDVLSNEIRTEVSDLLYEVGHLRSALEHAKNVIYTSSSKNVILINEKQQLIEQLDELKHLHSDEDGAINAYIVRLEKLEEMQKETLTKLDSVNEGYVKAQIESERLANSCRNGESEFSKLRTELSAATEIIVGIEGEAQSSAKSELERRFEESKYRLKSVLQTLHEREGELQHAVVEKSEYEKKLKEFEERDVEYQRHREYTIQLELQFGAQIKIVQLLKEKAIKHKMFADFVSTLHDQIESNSNQFVDVLDHFSDADTDDTVRKFSEIVRKLTHHYVQ